MHAFTCVWMHLVAFMATDRPGGRHVDASTAEHCRCHGCPGVGAGGADAVLRRHEGDVLGAQHTADSAGAEALVLAARAWPPGVSGPGEPLGLLLTARLGAARGARGRPPARSPAWSSPARGPPRRCPGAGHRAGGRRPPRGHRARGRHRARRGGGDDVDPRPGLARRAARHRARPTGPAADAAPPPSRAARLAGADRGRGPRRRARRLPLGHRRRAPAPTGSAGPPPTAETARATSAWWAANAAVIGADPDVLLPGQVLRPPPA